MEDKRYNEILGALPESVLVPLNHLRRFLNEGRAAVMVGAGFSKNAEMDEQTHMKSWNELGEDFYRKVHGDNAKLDNVRFMSVTRLAQQVEAMFHRHELEACMLQALPDKLISPGYLHKALMRLPWHDVFTTNYDTLLERAATDSDRKYNVVTNKETLLYKQSPRIIKLHGSFPDITPFIITEEDFRQYPMQFPEMVNTVRQSLIENVFCLIGFSGDDPNFLSWEGWLRDIMGTRVASVYMLDSRKNIAPAELELMRQRNISLINLADCVTINGRMEAFDFIFRFLSPEKESKQNLSFDFFKTKDEEPDKIINDLRNIRENYEGQFLLPKDLYRNFKEDESDVVFLSNRIGKWSNIQKLKFLYEVDWRLELSLTPKPIDLYVNVLSLYEDEYKGTEEENMMLTSLRISVLGVAMIRNMADLFCKIVDLLEKDNKNLWNNEMRNRYYYLRCQWESSLGNENGVRELLKSWNIANTDYRGTLWKTAIMYELRLKKESLEMLQETLALLRQKALYSDNNKEVLLSYKSILEWNIAIVSDLPYEVTDDRNDFRDIYNYLLRKFLENKDAKNDNEVHEEHGFAINDITRRINMSHGGYRKDYLSAYRLIKLFEAAGRPIVAISEEIHPAIAILAKYNFRYALGVCLRMNRNTALKDVLSRESILMIDTAGIQTLIDDLLKKVCTDDAMKDIKLKSRIEALSYLMVKSDKTQRLKYFSVLVKLFENRHRAYSRKCLSLLYENMSIAEIEDIIPRLFEIPLSILINEESIEIPELYKDILNKILPSEKAMKNIFEGLHSNNQKVVTIAHEYAYYISLTNLPKERKVEIRRIIAELRVQKPLARTIYYEWFPYIAEYDKDVDIDDVREKTVTKFVKDDYVYQRSSNFIQRFNRNYADIINISKLLDAGTIDWCISKVIDLLSTNKDVLMRLVDDKDGNMFFDMRNIVNKTLYLTMHLLCKLDDEQKGGIEKETLTKLWEILSPYEEKGIATLALKFQLSLILKNIKKEQFKDNAFRDVLSNKADTRNSAGSTIVFMADNGVSLQTALTAVTGRAYSVRGAYYYLRLLCLLVKKDKVRKTLCADIAIDLEHIYNVVNDETIPFDDKLDAMHGANILAGCCSVNGELMKVESLAKIVNIWKEYSEDENNFNDIRFGFEQGVNSCF